MKKTLLFGLSVALVFSCKKDELPEIINFTEPVYSSKIEIDNNKVIFNAGDNDFIMNTNSTTINNVEFLEGSISNSDENFTVLLSDGNIDKVKSSSYTNRKELPFYISDNVETFNFLKTDFENHLKITTVDWYVNEQFYATDDITITEPGKYKVCAFVTFSDETQNVLCNDIIVGYRKNAVGELKHLIELDGKIQAWINTDTEINSIKWYLDETLVCEDLELVTTSNSTSAKRIRAVINYANGVVRTKQVLTDLNQTGKYIQDFSENEMVYTRNNDFGLISTFKMNGEKYTTNIIENENAIIYIDSFEQGSLNLNGEPTIKLTARTSCFVKNTATGEIKSADLNFTLAFPIQ